MSWDGTIDPRTDGDPVCGCSVKSGVGWKLQDRSEGRVRTPAVYPWTLRGTLSRCPETGAVGAFTAQAVGRLNACV